MHLRVTFVSCKQITSASKESKMAFRDLSRRAARIPLMFHVKIFITVLAFIRVKLKKYDSIKVDLACDFFATNVSIKLTHSNLQYTSRRCGLICHARITWPEKSRGLERTALVLFRKIHFMWQAFANWWKRK